MEDYPVDDIIEDMNFSDNHFQTLHSGLMLTNWEISILSQYHIPYQKCQSLKELLYEIDKVLSQEEDSEELENVSLSVSERDYYQNTPF